jgi:CRP/FNR family transcriptional regulator
MPRSLFLSLFLGRNPDTSELRGLHQLAGTIDFRPGNMIFSEGDEAHSLFGVARGFVRLYKSMPGGSRQILAFAIPGDLLGMPLSEWHSCSAEAIGEVVLCRFARARFANFFQTNPNTMRRIVDFEANELESARELLLLLGNASAEERVMRFLVSWRNRLLSIGTPSELVPLPMQRKDIAEMLGLTKETVSRIFARLEAKSVLRTVPNGVIFTTVRSYHTEQ